MVYGGDGGFSNGFPAALGCFFKKKDKAKQSKTSINCQAEKQENNHPKSSHLPFFSISHLLLALLISQTEQKIGKKITRMMKFRQSTP